MTLLQWLVAALTAIFVAAVAFLQWRTAQQKAVLDLFDRRFEIYETVKNCVDQVHTNPLCFGGELEKEFLKAKNEAYFFFGDDVNNYLETLRKNILTVRDAYKLQPVPVAIKLQANGEPAPAQVIGLVANQAMNRINNFYKDGQPLFAKYMRFSQTVPPGIRQMASSRWQRLFSYWR
jgi:hypothetical protein